MVNLLQGQNRYIQILARAARTDQPVYLVGGAVRDLLLETTPHDLDFATIEPIKPLAKTLASELGASLFALDEKRGTYRIVETQSDGRHFTCDLALFRGEDLRADLTDRDFTINAMALDVRDPTRLIDPLGGAQDLHDKLLRSCSPVAFETDPVRVLRAVRHSVQFGLHIEADSLKQLHAAVPALERVSVERQRDELMKILSGQHPGTALRVLDLVGALKIILPEVEAMKGVPQSAPHVLDVWEHTLAMVGELEKVLGMLAEPFQQEKNASLWLGMASQQLGRYRPRLQECIGEELTPERDLRGLLFLAGLLHDCAKPAVRQVDEQGLAHFYTHEIKGANLARNVGRRLKLSELEVDFLGRLVGGHMRLHQLAKRDGPLTRRSIYRFFQSTGNAGVGVVLHSLADMLATYGVTLSKENWQLELNAARQLLEAWYEKPEESVAPPRIVTGDDIIQVLGVQPGRMVGQILTAIREQQACGEIQTHEQALDLAKRIHSQGLLAEGDQDGT
jgi:poly(A) polymerase